MDRPLLDQTMLAESTFCSLDVTLQIMLPKRYDKSLTSPCFWPRDMFHLRHLWVPYKDRTSDFRFTLRHRLLTRMLWQTDDPLWRSWVDRSKARLTNLTQQDDFRSATPETQLAKINETLKTDCASTFAQAPLLHAPLSGPDPFQQHVECKWTHWKLSRAQTASDLRSCFLSWRHWTSFLRLDREQQRVASLHMPIWGLGVLVTPWAFLGWKKRPGVFLFKKNARAS